MRNYILEYIKELTFITVLRILFTLVEKTV